MKLTKKILSKERGNLKHFSHYRTNCTCFEDYLQLKHLTIELILSSYQYGEIVDLFNEWAIGYPFKDCRTNKAYKLLHETVVLWIRKKDPAKQKGDEDIAEIVSRPKTVFLKNTSGKTLDEEN